MNQLVLGIIQNIANSPQIRREMAQRGTGFSVFSTALVEITEQITYFRQVQSNFRSDFTEIT